MERIRIQNVRTGKVMEITKMAWEQLKRGGHSKNFDVVANEKTPIKFNVPKTPEPEPENSIVDETEPESTEQPETPKKRTRKTTK
jgi:hypothetical protein